MLTDRSTKTRDKILQAAFSGLSRQGYENSSIKEIAEEAGVAQGLVHYYFKSKQQLVLAVLAEVCREMKYGDEQGAAGAQAAYEKFKAMLKDKRRPTPCTSSSSPWACMTGSWVAACSTSSGKTDPTSRRSRARCWRSARRTRRPLARSRRSSRRRCSGSWSRTSSTPTSTRKRRSTRSTPCRYRQFFSPHRAHRRRQEGVRRLGSLRLPMPVGHSGRYGRPARHLRRPPHDGRHSHERRSPPQQPAGLH